MNIQHSHKQILVAVDFSESSVAALKQAVWLASRTGASITLAHVLQTLHSPVTSEADPKVDMLTDLWMKAGESQEEFEAAARKETDAKMRRMVEQHADSIEVQTRIFIGSSFAEIVYAVKNERYDLVFAGTRGLAQWEQFLVGSTAKRLIRKCPSSVWVVKAEHVGQPKVVMAATDFSDVSFKAATEGLWIAQQADAEFHLLHVVDSNDVPEDAICRIPKGSSLQQEINEEATKRMNAFLDSLSVDRAQLQVYLAWGTPWKEIRRVAKHQGVDLVVMGTVGRSGIQGLFLGNTAEKVLDSCDCSILTVKPDGFVSPLAL